MKLLKEINDQIEYITESSDGGEKGYYLEGIFLQGDIKNKNGRIYPIKVLDEEVRRYSKEYIKDSRSYGELNHPCFKDTAEILTTEGWKFFDTLTGEEEVYTRNGQNDIEVKPIKKYVVNDFDGFLINIKGKNINTTVTPKHRFLVENSRTGEQKFVTAEDISNYINGISKLSEINSGKWFIPKRTNKIDRKSPETFTFEGSDTYKLDKPSNKAENLEIPFKTFIKFLGIYLAEGFTSLNERKNYYRTEVSQNEGDVCDLIFELMAEMENVGIKTNFSTSERKNRHHIFNIYDRRISEYLHKLGDCYTKYVPQEIINLLDEETAKLFIEWFAYGDGRGNLNNNFCNTFSVSEQLINDITQIAAIAGYSTNKTIDYPLKDYIFDNHLIKAENRKPLFFARIHFSNGIHLDKRFIKIEKEYHEGKVFCIQVENETFIARDNGFSLWSGNCGPSINLDKVSHLITDLKKDGSNYIGKARILKNMPNGKIVTALMDEKCKLGVSSRALGALRETAKGNVVDKLFLQTAADIVADPSAPDAFTENIIENTEWFFDGLDWVKKEKAFNLVEDFKQKNRHEREEKFLDLFRDLVDTINK